MVLAVSILTYYEHMHCSNGCIHYTHTVYVYIRNHKHFQQQQHANDH